MSDPRSGAAAEPMQQTTGRPQDGQASDVSLGRQPVSVSAAEPVSSSQSADGAVDPMWETLTKVIEEAINRRLGALERLLPQTARQDQVVSGSDEITKRLMREELIRNPRTRMSLPAAAASSA